MSLSLLVTFLLMCHVYYSEATTSSQVISKIQKQMENAAELSVKLNADFALALQAFDKNFANLQATTAKELNAILVPLNVKLHTIVSKGEAEGKDFSTCSGPVTNFLKLYNSGSEGEFLSCVTQQTVALQKLGLLAQLKVSEVEKKLVDSEAQVLACAGNYTEITKCYDAINVAVDQLSAILGQILPGILAKVHTGIATVNNNLLWCGYKVKKDVVTAGEKYIHEFIVCAALLGIV